MEDTLTIVGRSFGSRLILGTGKYESFALMRDAVVASEAEMVTVAVRRIDFDDPGEDITSSLPDDVLLLPNTSGPAACRTGSSSRSSPTSATSCPTRWRR